MVRSVIGVVNWLWQTPSRRASRRQACLDYTTMVTLVDRWNYKRNDLRLTAELINARRQHESRLQRASGFELTRTWLTPSEAYLVEYAKCENRHQALLNLDLSDNDAFEQATELEDAIMAIESIRSNSARMPNTDLAMTD